MSDKPLTEKQAATVRVVYDYLLKFGCYPTLDDLGDKLGLKSYQAAAGHVRKLVKAGYLTKERGEARGLRLAGVVLRPHFEGEGAKRLMRVLFQQEANDDDGRAAGGDPDQGAEGGVEGGESGPRGRPAEGDSNPAGGPPLAQGGDPSEAA